MHLERPPKIRLFFHLLVENGSAAPRWILLPDSLPHAARGVGREARTLEVYLLGAPRRVVVGHLSGAHGCQALLLPAGATVRLRRFPILFWGHEIPDQVTIEAISGAQLTIGGKPAADWFGFDPDPDRSAKRAADPAKPPAQYPVSDAGADVDAGALAEQMEVQFVRHAAGGQDLPVTLTESERIRFCVEIPP
jgi:hypothetical protein